MIITPRLRLCAWSERHRLPYVAMLADPNVMQDYGAPLGADQAAEKLARYAAVFRDRGFCRWAIEDAEGIFIGYTGVMPSSSGHPLGPHFEIGWRLVRSAWGFGYATEAARTSLVDFFQRGLAPEVLAYTAPDNDRSQAVMKRLGLARETSRDFTRRLDDRDWQGLVWVARP
jgi:RimJ/RimL family protein N-acetyltransferase